LQIERYNLDQAKDRHHVKTTGRKVMVYDASSKSAVIGISFDQGQRDKINLRFPSVVERNDDYRRVWLSHDAQPGQWVDLVFMDQGESLTPALSQGDDGYTVPPQDAVFIDDVVNGNVTKTVYTVPDDRTLMVRHIKGGGLLTQVRATDPLGVVVFNRIHMVNTVEGYDVNFTVPPGSIIGLYGAIATTGIVHIYGNLI